MATKKHIVVIPKQKARNPHALPASKRPAGPLKDRRTPRKGKGNPGDKKYIDYDNE